MRPYPIILLVCGGLVAAEDLAPRVRELERQVAELQAWRKAQEGHAPAAAKAEAGAGIIIVTIAGKRFQPADYGKGLVNEGLYWETTYRLTGREKPVRAVKGDLIFRDLFGEQRLRIAWTVSEPFTQGKPLVERGKGIVYDATNENHVWLKAQKEADLQVSFVVKRIVYQDGTSEAFGAE